MTGSGSGRRSPSGGAGTTTAVGACGSRHGSLSASDHQAEGAGPPTPPDPADAPAGGTPAARCRRRSPVGLAPVPAVGHVRCLPVRPGSRSPTRRREPRSGRSVRSASRIARIAEEHSAVGSGVDGHRCDDCRTRTFALRLIPQPVPARSSPFDGGRHRHRQPGQSARSTAQALQFAEAYVAEDLVLQTARSLAHEVGLPAITPGAGAALRLLAAAGSARSVVEIGTGTGVSGVWLLRGMRPDGVLTTIDVETEHQRIARRIFQEAGFAAVAYPDHHRPGARRAAPARRRRSTTWSSSTPTPPSTAPASRPPLRLLRPGGVLVLQRRAGRRPDRRPGRPRRRHGDRPRDRQGRSASPTTGSRPCSPPATGLLAAVNAARARSASQRSRVRTPQPVAPLVSSPSLPSAQEGADMSMCTQRSRSGAGELAQVERGDHRAGAAAPGRCSRSAMSLRGTRRSRRAAASARPARRRPDRAPISASASSSFVAVERGGAACRARPRWRRSAWPGRSAGPGASCVDRVRERVGEHQPALGVGVGALAGEAAVVADHVAGPERRAADHVLGERGERGDPYRQAQRGGADGGGERRRRRRPCPCASASSPSRGLIEMPPVSKVMPLPTSTTCRCARRPGCQVSSTRRGPRGRAAADGEDAAEALGGELLGLADRDASARAYAAAAATTWSANHCGDLHRRTACWSGRGRAGWSAAVTRAAVEGRPVGVRVGDREQHLGRAAGVVAGVPGRPAGTGTTRARVPRRGRVRLPGSTSAGSAIVIEVSSGGGTGDRRAGGPPAGLVAGADADQQQPAGVTQRPDRTCTCAAPVARPAAAARPPR